MSSEQFREQGIQAAKARRTDEARQLLQQAVRLNPQDETAWLYLASVSEDKKERLACLQKVLEINPQSELGRKAVQAMGIDPEKVIALSRQQSASQPPVQPLVSEEPEPEPPSRPALRSLKSPPPPPPPPPSPAIRPLAPSPSPASFGDDGEDDYDDGGDDGDEFSSEFDDFNEFESFNEFEEEPADFATEVTDPEDQMVPEDAVEAAPASRLPMPPPSDPSAPPGVPIPDINYLEEALIYAEGIAKRYNPIPPTDVQWIHKETRRAGERDIVALRLQVGGAIFGALLVLGVLGVVIFNSSPEAQRILGIRTRTATLTPSVTPTNTPGLTPTPSVTPDFTLNPTYTPSPTIPITLLPVGNVNATPRPTLPYLPAAIERPILNAAALMDIGNYEAAIPTLASERLNTSSNYNPNPYYYEARVLALAGEISDAEAIVAEAEERLSEVNTEQSGIYRALVDLAAAEVEVQRGVEALNRGNPGGAASAFAAARERLEAVIAFDVRYERAYVLMARTYSLQNDFAEAITILDQARANDVAGLYADQSIILEKAETHMMEGDSLQASSPEAARGAYQNADYQAYLAYYINPYNEVAHDIRVRAALAQGDPGLAVLYIENYLLYYPNSPRALRLLAVARIAEGNLDRALEGFTQSLNTNPDDSVRADILLSRAELYTASGRDALALADLNAAFELRPTPEVQALRLRAAYRAGDYVTAGNDAAALSGLGILPEAELALLQARIVIDENPDTDADAAQEALTLLNSFSDDSLVEEQRPLANEYRARAYLRLGDPVQALNSINQAVTAAESGSRRYLRAQILAANEQPEAAIRDYEWVLAWDTVYDFEFAEAALEGLTDAQATVEAYLQATAAVETMTAMPTPTATFTATPTATP